MNAAEIARVLGWNGRGSNIVVRCPVHDDHTPSLSLADGKRGLLLRCWAGCDVRDVLAELRRRGLLPAHRDDPPPRRAYRPSTTTPRREPTDAERTARARAIWSAAHDPRATIAEQYLAGRGLRLDDDLAGRVLRFHPACAWEDRRVPALIAALRPVVGDLDENVPPTAILRIGLDERGGKIAKKMLGPVAGCAVKLDADENVSLGLGIAEGLETSLAVRAAGWRPIWCLGSAGAISTFAPLAGIEAALTIFADSDANGVGTVAARECAAAGRGRVLRLSFARRARSASTGWTRSHETRHTGTAFRRERHRRAFRAALEAARTAWLSPRDTRGMEEHASSAA